MEHEVQKVKNTHSVYYIIEEYQGLYDRWVSIQTPYLEDFQDYHENGGECWKRTRHGGTYDFLYAKQYCDALNKSLEDGELSNIPDIDGISLIDALKITKFRVCKIKESYEQTVVDTSWLSDELYQKVKAEIDTWPQWKLDYYEQYFSSIGKYVEED